jgi:hypothetical protein
MNRKILFLILIGIAAVLLTAAGCDKEKIVESTEIVKETQYIQLPPDTIVRVDTVFRRDSVTVRDTVIIHDTIIQPSGSVDTVTVIDTVIRVVNHYDTIVTIDTVVTIQHHYDTTIVIDTVVNSECGPNAFFATTALQYHTDPLVIDFINQEFGYDDGWVFYLSAWQSGYAVQSSKVYDIYGYIDYWTPEWDGYYTLEYYWRMTYVSGDPANPDNWRMTEPPSTAMATTHHQAGLRLVPDGASRPGK